MTILYLDCFSGVSGDMLLGALVDAGVPERVITEAVGALGVEGWSISVEEIRRGAIRARHARVSTSEQRHHRNLGDIEALLDGSGLRESVSDPARRAFRLIAEAEARVHGTTIEQVHFHEVGALDAIVDVVGCCAALAHLAPERVVCSPLTTGRGFAMSEHGTIPVPGPAVIEIARIRGIPLGGRGDLELVTPTGIALAATFAHDFGHLPEMTVTAVGYGAGMRDPQDVPNVLRAIVGEPRAAEAEDVLLIEGNLDDVTGEQLAYALERLLDAGAQDAWAAPIVMKKGRPAHTLSVLCASTDVDRLTEIVFRETTTLGLRVTAASKRILERDWITVEVAGEPLRVKLGLVGGRAVTLNPEYEEAAAIARANGLPLKEVYAQALERARAQLSVG